MTEDSLNNLPTPDIDMEMEKSKRKAERLSQKARRFMRKVCPFGSTDPK